jgi:hypothetical protein
VNHGPSDGQYLDVLDDAGKIIARFYSLSFAFPSDHRVYGNTVIIEQTDTYTLENVMKQWQPFRITAQDGPVTFQYAAYPAVTTSVFEAGAKWQRAKKLQLFYLTANNGAYGRAIALYDLTYSTASAPLVSDTFTATDGTQLVGRAPANANLPGDVYARSGSSGWGRR